MAQSSKSTGSCRILTGSRAELNRKLTGSLPEDADLEYDSVFKVINPMLYAFCGKQFRLRTLQMLEKMIGRRLPLAKRSLLDRSGINSDSFRKKSTTSHWPTNESHFYLSTRTSVSQKPSGTNVEERLLSSNELPSNELPSDDMPSNGISSDQITAEVTPCDNISCLQMIFEPKPNSRISKNS